MKAATSTGFLLALQSIGCAGYTSWSYTNQSEVPYYGLSPPVYPSREQFSGPYKVFRLT